MILLQGVQIDMEHVEEYQEFLARHKHTLEKRDFAKAATSGQPSDATSPRAPSVSTAATTPASPAVDTQQSVFLDLGLGSVTPSSSLASPSAAIPNSDAVRAIVLTSHPLDVGVVIHATSPPSLPQRVPNGCLPRGGVHAYTDP